MAAMSIFVIPSWYSPNAPSALTPNSQLLYLAIQYLQFPMQCCTSVHSFGGSFRLADRSLQSATKGEPDDEPFSKELPSVSGGVSYGERKCGEWGCVMRVAYRNTVRFEVLLSLILSLEAVGRVVLLGLYGRV